MQECPEIDRGTLLSAAVSSSEAPGGRHTISCCHHNGQLLIQYSIMATAGSLHNVQMFIQSGSAQDRLNQIIKSGSNLIDTL